MARTIRFLIEYDGTDFAGWQKQPVQRTVQGEIEAALAEIHGGPVILYGAGRTDAGVHALGQVASFETIRDMTPEALRRAVNGLTGSDLQVRRADEVASGFHARHSARGRHYLYLLLRERSALWSRRAHWAKHFPDPDLMNAACLHLLGERDFGAFSVQGDEEDSTRSHLFYARWDPWDRGLMLRVGAVRFLYKMVRCLVALSLEVGRGRAAPESFAERCREAHRRCELVAPPQGVHLLQVDYEDSPGVGRWAPDCLPRAPVL